LVTGTGTHPFSSTSQTFKLKLQGEFIFRDNTGSQLPGSLWLPF